MKFSQEKRSKIIGGSDIAAIIGLDEYRTPYDVWCEKTGRSVQTVDNKYMRAGRYLERSIISMFRDETGHKIKKNSATIIKGYFAATVDAFFADSKILECKTTQKTLEDPLASWVCQVQWYMMMHDANQAAIAWLERGLDFKIRYIDRNQEIIDMLRDAAIKFYEENVLQDVAPEPLSIADINVIYRTEKSGKEIEGNSVIADIYNKLILLREQHKNIDSEIDRLKGMVKLYMRDAETLKISGKKLFSWRTRNNVRTFLIHEIV